MASGLELFSVVGKLVLDKGQFDSEASEAEQTGKSLAENLSNFFGKVKKAIEAAAVVAAIKKVSSALFDLAKDTAAVGDKIDKQSQALGMSRKAYQEWEYILSQSGASIDSMATVMRTMGSAIMENSAETAAALSKLGLSSAHLQSIAPEKQFEAIVRAFQKMPASAQKTQLAIQLFGRGAQELMPLLNSATDSIDQLRQNAEDLGLIMSDEDVDASVAFGDALDDLTRAWTAFKNRIGAQLLPGFTDFFIEASHTIGGLSTALVGAIKSGDWALFFSTLSTEIERVIPQLLDGALSVLNGLAANADKFTGLAASIAVGLGKAIAAAAPVLLGELPSFVSSIWDGLKGDVEGLANDVINTINETFGTNIPELKLKDIELPKSWEELKAFLQEATTKNITIILKGIKQIENFHNNLLAWEDATAAWGITFIVKKWAEVQSAFNQLGEWADKTWKATVEWAETTWEGIKGKFDSLVEWGNKTWNNVVSWTEETWGGISEKFTQLGAWTDKVWRTTVEWINDTWDSVKGAFDTVGSWVDAGVKTIKLAWDSTLDSVGETVKGWIDKAPDLLLNFLSGIVSPIIEWVKGWTSPKSAKLNIDGEPDEHVSNVESWISDAPAVHMLFDGILTGVAKTVQGWAQSGINIALNFTGSITDALGIGDTSVGSVGTPDWIMGAVLDIAGIPHAKGLNYVPYDGYIAELHRGETILNQDQGREWRQNGGSGFDMREIGGLIADAVAAAVGDIQINMDGRQVGNAVTDYVSKNIYQRQNGRRFAAV